MFVLFRKKLTEWRGEKSNDKEYLDAVDTTDKFQS